MPELQRLQLICSSAPMARVPVRDLAAEAALDAWGQRVLREVSATQLTQAQRNAVWRHVKAQCPARVRFLQHPEVQRLIRERGAAPTFPPELIRTALASQPKVTTP